jgi:hypothetical protein
MHSQDEAVKVSLLLSSAESSISRSPEFDLNPKYRNAEVLADAVNELLKQVDESSVENSLDLVAVKHDSTEQEVLVSLTDSEIKKTCSEWKTNYNVVTGVSWGDLPYDLQQKWSQYSCDRYLLNS